MSDGSLSQEEIDALLQGADDIGPTIDAGDTLGGLTEAPSAGLTAEEKNEISLLSGEVAQSMGVTLSTITGKTAEVSNPQLEVLAGIDYISQISEKNIQISADYSEGITGKHWYIITEAAAKQVSALMMGQEEGELTEMALSALTEGFSQMSGASMNVFEDRAGISVKTGTLQAEMKENPSDLDLPDGSFLRVRFDLTSNGSSSIIDEIFDINTAKSLAAGIFKKKGIDVQEAPVPQSAASFGPGIQQNASVFNTGPDPGFGQGNVGVQPVQFSPFSMAEQSGVTGNIGLLMDVSMQLTVELGRTKMLIKDILGMGEGTIVELDKLAGEPVDLLVNGKLIAKGEVVVIDENFGVRVTDIISPMDRISNLE